MRGRFASDDSAFPTRLNFDATSSMAGLRRRFGLAISAAFADRRFIPARSFSSSLDSKP
jgi:hypothetical protein